jgi:type VI secretion system secreted protein Hcp
MSRCLFVVLAGLAILGTALPASAQEIYCTFTAAKQGTLKDDAKSSQIPVLFLTEEVSVPYDTATGVATGKRTDKPLTIVKELDSTSVQLFLAAVTNEAFPSVTCIFYHRSQNGSGEAYFKISLTNALITDYRNAGDGVNGDASGDERERVSFAYEKIELMDLTSGATATDDWLGTT